MGRRSNSNPSVSASLAINDNTSGSSLTNHEQFLRDVIHGLSLQQKTLPCKYFYDEKGSYLFEQICQLEEYYITRTELKLITDISSQLSQKIGKKAVIIEPGAGAGLKIQILLQALLDPQSYVPIDISKDFLFYSTAIIQNKFPQIEVIPIAGDFTLPIKWKIQQQKNRVVFFPGSTIGNFNSDAAIDFLVNMRHLVGSDGAIILGVDLLKDKQTLINAYDDKKGITERFNKNLLSRINRELGANFQLDDFIHEARFNEKKSRIEMHLVSSKNQNVVIAGQKISLYKNESIHTENSHKYPKLMMDHIITKSGLKRIKTWQDPQALVAIHYLVPA